MPRRATKESSLQFHWRVVSSMLRAPPWDRLPLTARWLKQEYRLDFEPGLQPPLHIPLAFGAVRAKKQQQQPSQSEEEEEVAKDWCFLCKRPVKVRLGFFACSCVDTLLRCCSPSATQYQGFKSLSFH